jgi:hypothetical protein
MACPRQRTRNRVAQHTIAISSGVLFAVLISAVTQPAFAQTPQQDRYVISIGTESERLTGTLWLYSYSWYGLQSLKLATIENGLAVVPVDTSGLKREMDPHPNTDAYVLAIQIGEHLWYRTPDISRDDFWTDLPRAIRSLGKATALPTGETQLIVPSPTKRHITLLYPDGRPKANTDLTVSVYVSDQNHCGFHEGLPLGNLRTDEKGTIEVLAPLVPLYLDGLQYYANVGAGPAGAAYSANTGMKIGPEETVVRKEQWDVQGFTAELQVLTRSGRPRSDVNIYGNWDTNTCGGVDRIGQTDAKGIARIDLDPTFTALRLMLGGPYKAGDPEGHKNTRNLTDAEMREVLSKHKLTIRW